MNKNRKKGFTLVELLVVISILAVLAVVTVVGYTSFTKKAKVSNDVSLTTQLNTILQANETTDGANKYPHEAAQELVEGGFDVTKFTPTTEKYNYVYDLSQNRIFLLDENYSVVAPSDLTLTSDKASVFGFANSQDEVTKFNNAGFSVYLKSTYDSDSVSTTKGIDVGSVENVNVSLVSTIAVNSAIRPVVSKAVSNTQTSYVVRTNGGTLTINNSEAVVSHFGTSTKVEITSVSKHSEYGEVTNIEIKSGSVAIDESAKVNTVIVTGDDVKVDSEVKTVDVKVASTVSKAPEVKVGGETKDVSANKAIFVTVINSNSTYVKLGASNPLESIVKIKEGDYLVLNNDLTTKKILINNVQDVTIDLNGHNITCTEDVTAFVVEKASVTIKGSGSILSAGVGIGADNNASITINDVNVEAQNVSVLVYDHSTATINSGTFTSKDNFVVGTNGTKETDKDYSGSTITINGGTFNGYSQKDGSIACGIYAANDDTWYINGGTFNITNGCGILARSGVVNVSKDVVINLFNDGNTVEGTVGDSKYHIVSGAALIEDHISDYPGGTPEIINNSSYEVTKQETN